MSESNTWKKCSSCKRDIGLGAKFYVCSVSTCQHPRKGFQFCSVPCWDAHLGYANHKESWAIEKKAPINIEADTLITKNIVSTESRNIRRKVIEDSCNSNYSKSSAGQPYDLVKKAGEVKTDTLVVVSKIKKLIKDESGFNTSQCCIDALTKKIIVEALKAIENAKKSERKTVMGRDVV